MIAWHKDVCAARWHNWAELKADYQVLMQLEMSAWFFTSAETSSESLPVSLMHLIFV